MKNSAGARPRGVTLVETLIHSSLMLLLLGGIVAVLILGTRSFRKVEAVTEVQREMAAAVAALRTELAETRPGSIASGTNPTGVIFLSPRPDAGPWAHSSTGKLLWQRWVCYYVETRNGVPTLLRKEKKLSAPTAIPPANTWRTSDFSGDTSRARVVARSVKGLQVTGTDLVNVQVEVELTSGVGRKERMVVQESVQPRQP